MGVEGDCELNGADFEGIREGIDAEGLYRYNTDIFDSFPEDPEDPVRAKRDQALKVLEDLGHV